MTSRHVYTMQRRLQSRLEHAHGPLICQRCGAPICTGQDVVSKSRNHRRTKASYTIYHAACFETLLH
jgi:RNase P subunit RPR2